MSVWKWTTSAKRDREKWCFWYHTHFLDVAEIPKSFSLASRRRPSSIVSILPWNVWYRRILHWGYNVLLKKKKKSQKTNIPIYSDIQVFSHSSVICILKSHKDLMIGVHAKSPTHWPLRGPAADAEWEDQRDRCPLVIHAGILTFSTASLHLQKVNMKMSSSWIHVPTVLQW